MPAPDCVNHDVAVRLEKSVSALRFAARTRRFLPTSMARPLKTAQFAHSVHMVKAMSLFIG
jgi:hypothetical protein